MIRSDCQGEFYQLHLGRLHFETVAGCTINKAGGRYVLIMGVFIHKS